MPSVINVSLGPEGEVRAQWGSLLGLILWVEGMLGIWDSGILLPIEPEQFLVFLFYNLGFSINVHFKKWFCCLKKSETMTCITEYTHHQ